MEEIKKIISLVVINESSTLSRITSLFAGRGYNIESLTVAPIINSEYSNITIFTKGNLKTIEQITKQLNKLIPVVKVIESHNIVTQEMLLIKFPINKIVDIKILIDVYNGTITDIGTDSFIVTISNEPSKIKSFINVSKKFHPIKIISGGVVAIER